MASTLAARERTVTAAKLMDASTVRARTEKRICKAPSRLGRTREQSDSRWWGMGKASITNLLPADRASSLRSGLGRELRRRRLEAHLSQANLSVPLTRAYISQVESRPNDPLASGAHRACRAARHIGRRSSEIGQSGLERGVSCRVMRTVERRSLAAEDRDLAEQIGVRLRAARLARRPDPARSGRGPLHQGLRQRPRERIDQAIDGRAPVPRRAVRDDRKRSPRRRRWPLDAARGGSSPRVRRLGHGRRCLSIDARQRPDADRSAAASCSAWPRPSAGWAVPTRRSAWPPRPTNACRPRS